MPIVDFSNTLTVILAIILFLLVLYIGKETERSWLLAGAVISFLALLVCHICELTLIKNIAENLRNALNTSVIIDFGFVLISFAGYAWINYLHSKKEKNENKVLEENSDYYSKKKKQKIKK